MATRRSTSISSPSPTLADLLQKLYATIEHLKHNHENDLDGLNKRIQALESENRTLRVSHEQHPHSIFDIDYVSNDADTIAQLRADLDRSQKHVDALQAALDQQYSDLEDMKSKYSLQRLMNEGHFEQNNGAADPRKVKDLETKLTLIKEQIAQFDQCSFESDEQLRLLKQILYANEHEPTRPLSQSLTVKQSDLSQQTDYVESLLNKQHDKILNKIVELLDQNSRHDHPVTGKSKRAKKKRL